MRYFISCLAVLVFILPNTVYAHEMVPAYPRLEPAFVDGIIKAELSLFNRRIDVDFYQITVFDKEWEPMPFATETNILQLEYLSRKKFTVYLKEEDLDKAGWVCTRSKLLKGEGPAVVSSRICSKFVIGEP